MQTRGSPFHSDEDLTALQDAVQAMLGIPWPLNYDVVVATICLRLLCFVARVLVSSITNIVSSYAFGLLRLH